MSSWRAGFGQKSKPRRDGATTHFEFNLFDIELFFGEDRITIKEAAALGYEDAQVTLHDFLAAIPDVSPGWRMPGRPRRVIVPPPPSD